MNTSARNIRSQRQPLLSIVVPMKDEARGLDRFLERLGPVVDRLGFPAEMIAVDDGSTDETMSRLKALRAQVPYLRALSLSRNFGKELAVLAGVEHARGDIVVLIDADLGHPPEMIGSMVELWREGWQVVYGQRFGFQRAPLRGVLTRLFYRSFQALSETPIDPAGGDFMLLDRKVVDAFVSMRERHRFTRGLIAWAGFRTTSIAVPAGDGEGRVSRWSLDRLIGLAVNAITSFGTLPLRVWTYVGVTIAAASVLYAFYTAVKALVLGPDVPGFPTLAVAVTFLAGVQLIGLGILGEYIGRIFAETKGRPLYLVQEAVGFEEEGQRAGRAAEVRTS